MSPPSSSRLTGWSVGAEKSPSSFRLTGWGFWAESHLLGAAVRFPPKRLKVGGRKRRKAGDSKVEWAMGEPEGGLGGELKGLWMRPFARTFKNLLL